MKGTKALVKMLEDKNVETMFGYPGGSVIPLYDALYDSSIRHVLVRHEQCAAHMADGFARASGLPGVCLATSGPGVTNLVTGVATAYADSVPMMVLSGQVKTNMLGLGAFQEVDAYSLLMPVTKHNFRVLDVNRLPHAIKEAWEVCRTGRPGPVHVDLPVDQMDSDMDEALLDETYGIKPDPEDLSGIAAAAQWIREAERPVVLVGGGAVGASEEVRRLVELLQAPVDATLLGLGVVPSSYALNMGPLGMHGRLSAKSAMNEADLVISIGSRFSDRTYSPRSKMTDPRGRVIHIDVDPTEFGKHGHSERIDILGDAKKAVPMLTAALEGYRPKDAWRERAAEFKSRCACECDIGRVPIIPQKLMHEIGKMVKDDTIVATDVGQNQMWAMHHLDFEHPRRLLSSGTFGTMGYGLPAAIGAKAAKPDSDVIAITGDGGFQMVMQEMATSIAEDLPVTVVLLNNGTLGMVRQWQKLFWNARYSNTTLRGDPDFVKLAEAFGAKGIRVEKPGEIGDALREGRDCGRTCLVEVVVDRDEDVLPMLPADPNAPVPKGRCTY
ncbi:MAG: biosynthetic-type acetolactate synthase large subunit [Candidatus Methanomethylophilaceae archaeon]|nr:biosynthetic-type acetolactate synthase large subunit [Candidatus Methanomethylophilaceae archaeon]